MVNLKYTGSYRGQFTLTIHATVHSLYTSVIQCTRWCGCLNNYMEHLIITKYSFRGCTATWGEPGWRTMYAVENSHTEITSTWCGIEWHINAVRFSPRVCDTRWHNHNKYSTYRAASTPQTSFPLPLSSFSLHYVYPTIWHSARILLQRPWRFWNPHDAWRSHHGCHPAHHHVSHNYQENQGYRIMAGRPSRCLGPAGE